MTTTFITGATGLIGAEYLAHALTQSDDSHFILLMRAADLAALEQRLDELLDFLFPNNANRYRHRVEAVAGDISQPQLGLDMSQWRRLNRQIDVIVHCAASTAWHMDLGHHRQHNVYGVEKVLKLAYATDHLQRLLHVSTAYVSGSQSGRILPTSNYRRPTCDDYQQSKREGERLIQAATLDLPITIVRPAGVVGNSANGRARTFDTLYYPLKLMTRGYPVIFPVGQNTTYDTVPADWMAAAMHCLMYTPAAISQTYHLTAGERAITVEQLLELMARTIKGDVIPPQIVHPLWWRWIGYPRLMKSGNAPKAIINHLSDYTAYIAYRRTFDNHATLALGIPPPPVLEDYLNTIYRYAVEQKWKSQRRQASVHHR